MDYTYLKNTIYKSYVFAFDIDQVLKETKEVFFEDDGFFNYIENEVKQNEEFEYLDCFAKENIFKIINLFREYYKEKEAYEERVERINNMIISLNRSEEHNVYDFYRDEVISRNLYQSKIIKCFEKKQPSLLTPVIREMIVYDAYLLLRLNGRHEIFLSELGNIVNNENTIYSLNKFFDEYPELLDDPVVNDRVRAILQLSLNKSKGYILDYRDNVKVMSKYINIQKR